MARGYVRRYRLLLGKSPYGQAIGTGGPQWRYGARVEAQGLVVWRDDGYPDLNTAMSRCAEIAKAFYICEAKGQHFISWDQVVDEVPRGF